MGHDEEGRRGPEEVRRDTDDVVVATKGGITRHEGNTFGRDGSVCLPPIPVEKSLRRLDVDVIDLVQSHRPDRWQVYGEVIGHLKTLQDEGKIKAIGISNANGGDRGVIQVLGEGGLASVQANSPRFEAARLSWITAASRASPSAMESARRRGGRRTRGRRAFRGFQRDRPRARRQSPTSGVGLGTIAGASRHSYPRSSPAESITDFAKAASLVLSDAELARCSASGGSG